MNNIIVSCKRLIDRRLISDEESIRLHRELVKLCSAYWDFVDGKQSEYSSLKELENRLDEVRKILRDDWRARTEIDQANIKRVMDARK